MNGRTAKFVALEFNQSLPGESIVVVLKVESEGSSARMLCTSKEGNWSGKSILLAYDNS